MNVEAAADARQQQVQVQVPVVTDTVDTKTWHLDHSLRNAAYKDWILDWIDQHGETHKLVKDSDAAAFDPTLEFGYYTAEQNGRFFKHVINYLIALLNKLEPAGYRSLAADESDRKLFPSPMVQIALQRSDVYKICKYEETLFAMRSGVPIISKAVLHDPVRKLVCSPHLLVRSDLLPKIVRQLPKAAAVNSLDGSVLHYVPVIVAFTTLRFRQKDLKLTKTGSNEYRSLLLCAYNEALSHAHADGHHPKVGFLLGRGWQCGSARSRHALSTVAAVGVTPEKTSELTDALQWRERLRAEGKSWSLLPKPSLPELYPNMKNKFSFPWSHAKSKIAKQLNEITLLWHCAVRHRQNSHAKGIFEYTDPKLTTGILGIHGAQTSKVLAQILRVNQAATLAAAPSTPSVESTSEQPPRLNATISPTPTSTLASTTTTPSLDFWPDKILNRRSKWPNAQELEFFVDFETVSSLMDPFTSFPLIGDTTMIGMIGCGYWDRRLNKWEMKIFVCDTLCMAEEKRIITEWLQYMDSVKQLKAPNMTEKPRTWHWSMAELCFLEINYNCASRRHQLEAEWCKRVRWADLMKVFEVDPVTLRGCLGFGLKAVGKALFEQKKITQQWPDHQVDNGMSAMVALIRCHQMAVARNITMSQVSLMNDLKGYLRLDVYMMFSVLQYLREFHV